MKNKYGFILIKPQLGENIGASARSLKNFGFKNLIITNPKHGWPNIKAKATSVGAFDILNKTKVFDNTNSAIQNFDIIFSFSARKRDINKKHISLNKFLNITKKFKQKKNWINVWSRGIRFIKSRFILCKLCSSNTIITKI